MTLLVTTYRGRGGCEPVQVVFGGDLGVCCCSAQAPSQSATAPGSTGSENFSRERFSESVKGEQRCPGSSTDFLGETTIRIAKSSLEVRQPSLKPAIWRERERDRTQEQIDDSASVEDWLSKSDQLNRVNAKHCKNYK